MVANKKKLHSIVGVCLFLIYLTGLFYFLFFAEGMGRTTSGGEYRYNLTLLKEIKRFYMYQDALGWKAYFLNVFGNVLAFMPFGFFLPMLLAKKNIFLTTFWGFLLSLFVEAIQLSMKLGSFDVDDLLLNTIGAFLGACIYGIIRFVKGHNK